MGGKQSPKTIKRVGVLEEKLKSLVQNVAPDASQGVLLQADKAFSEGGKVGLFKHLTTQQWGTRKHYYMSEAQTEDALEGFVDSLFPSEGIEPKMPKADVGMGVKEAQTRRGQAMAKEGALIPSLFHHIHKVKMMGMLADDVENLTRKFMASEPSRKDIKLFKRNMKNALGFAEEGVRGIEVAEKANRIFWRTYPISFGRAAWYTSRNLLQNIGLGPGQVNMAEATKAIGSFATEGTSDLLDKHMRKYFGARISQKRPMHRHFMLLDKSQAMKEVGNKGIRILDTIGEVIPLSDEANRLIAFPITHKIAESAVADYRAGKINF